MKLNPNKEYQFHLRVTQEQYDFLMEISKKFDTKPSHYIRNVIDQQIASYNIAKVLADNLKEGDLNKLTLNLSDKK